MTKKKVIVGCSCVILSALLTACSCKDLENDVPPEVSELPMVGPGNRPRAEGTVLEVGDRKLSVAVEVSDESRDTFSAEILALDCSSPMLFSAVKDLEEGDLISFTYEESDTQDNPLTVTSVLKL